jgi:hypothetical protein
MASSTGAGACAGLSVRVSGSAAAVMGADGTAAGRSVSMSIASSGTKPSAGAGVGEIAVASGAGCRTLVDVTSRTTGTSAEAGTQ